jgi:succinate dehydrogenase / fumarate reductase, cytochrome b subunit
MAKRDKPLVRPMSPHLGIYRWQYTNTLSILHRATGVALTAGTPLLVYWLVAAASGAEEYAQAQELLSNGLLQVALVGWVFSFCYHFCNGIRHLVWDTGRGFDLKVARASGYAAVGIALLLTAIVFFVFWVRAGGAA